MSTKINKNTYKAAIKRLYNNKNLYIKGCSSFDGMTEGVEPVNDDFHLVENLDFNQQHTYGMNRAWFTGTSDYIYLYEDEIYTGFVIYNCCGSFITVGKKEIKNV